MGFHPGFQFLTVYLIKGHDIHLILSIESDHKSKYNCTSGHDEHNQNIFPQKDTEV